MTKNAAKHARRTILALRKLIPEMDCIPGCTDCCGLFPWHPWELAQIKDKKYATSGRCPYSLNGGCEVYSDRPITCRLYGVAAEPWELACPHGRMPKAPLTPEEADAIFKEYLKDWKRTEERSPKLRKQIWRSGNKKPR